MVRIKNRWLLIEFLNPELNEGLPPLTTSKIYHAIKNSVIINFGDAGWGAVGVSLNIKYYSPTTSLCILKVGREHIRIARAAVTLLTSLEGSPVIPNVVHCSGTIKKTQVAAIEYNRIIVARFRSRMYTSSGSGKTVPNDKYQAYLETSTRELEALQD